MKEKKKPLKTLPRPKSKPKAPPARRRRASEGPHKTETLYRALAEAAPDMIFIIGRDDRVEYVNRVAAESLGRTPEDMIGRPRAQFFPSEPSQRQGERISDVFESGKPFFIENYTPFKGRVLWLHTWLVPLRNEAGEVASVLGISRDITERKKAEESLRESEEKYRTLVERAGDGIFIVQDGIIQFTNPKLGLASGYEAGEIQGKRFTQFIHPTEIPTVIDRYRRRLAGEEVPAIYETTLLRKDGSKLPAEINAGIISYQGKPADLVIVRDLTERKRSEEALRTQERLLESVYSSIQDGISVLDHEYRIVSVNPTMEQWYAHAMPLEGKKCYEAYHGFAEPCEICPTRRTLETGRTAYEVVPRRGKDGEVVGWLDLFSFPQTNPETKAVVGVIEYVRDITERKWAEEKLHESEIQHRTTLDFMGDAIHVVDRDLRLVLVNDRFKQWCRELGLGTELVGRTVFEAFPFLPEKIREEYDRVFLTGETLITEEASRVGEREIITETRKIPIHQVGKVAQVVTVVHDITARKRSEIEIRQERNLITRLFETSPSGIVRVDRDGRITTANDQAERVLGLAKEEITQRSYNAPAWSITDYEGNPFPDESLPFRRVMATGKPVYDVRHAIEWPDGRRVLLSVNASPLFDESGKLDGMVATVEDITGRIRGEEALRKNYEHQGLILQNLPVVFYTAAPTSDLPTTWISSQVRELTGFAPDRFKAEPWFWTSRIHPEDHERVLREYEAVLARGAVHVEYRWQTAEGAYHWFLDTAVLAKDAQGQPLEVNGIWVDITGRKRAEQDLRDGAERLRRALWETIGAMAVIVETRDPYTAGHQRRVTHLAEEIAREMSLSEEQIQEIRMSGLIHDIGKISVPAEILSKPTPLSETEFSIIKSHVRVGFDILKAIEFPWPVAPIVAQHHERMDGSGYPKGLRGEEIYIEARIIAVADVIEAMYSYRPYRPAPGLDKGLEEITRNRGLLYDPQVVDACLKLFSEKGFSFEPEQEKG